MIIFFYFFTIFINTIIYIMASIYRTIIKIKLCITLSNVYLNVRINFV